MTILKNDFNKDSTKQLNANPFSATQSRYVIANANVESQKTVCSYYKSKQKLRFGFAEPNASVSHHVDLPACWNERSRANNRLANTRHGNKNTNSNANSGNCGRRSSSVNALIKRMITPYNES